VPCGLTKPKTAKTEILELFSGKNRCGLSLYLYLGQGHFILVITG